MPEFRKLTPEEVDMLESEGQPKNWEEPSSQTRYGTQRKETYEETKQRYGLSRRKTQYEGLPEDDTDDTP